MPTTRVTSKQQLSITADLDFTNAFRGVNHLNPVNPQDVATKFYVDSMSQGLDFKESSRVASTGNVAGTFLATGGTGGKGSLTGAPTAIDGVTLATGDRVLLKDQTAGIQNGIWVVTTPTTLWERAKDFDSDAEVSAGAYTFVSEGTVNSDSGWVLTTNDPITLNTTVLVWAQFSGAGQIDAGAGLLKTGNIIDVQTASVSRIVVNADNIDL